MSTAFQRWRYVVDPEPGAEETCARRIRVADIERLRRTLENVPESRVDEVTTVQAVRMLTSEIQAMQAKGYGLRSIAALLSENSVVVTAATLKS